LTQDVRGVGEKYKRLGKRGGGKKRTRPRTVGTTN